MNSTQSRKNLPSNRLFTNASREPSVIYHSHAGSGRRLSAVPFGLAHDQPQGSWPMQLMGRGGWDRFQNPIVKELRVLQKVVELNGGREVRDLVSAAFM